MKLFNCVLIEKMFVQTLSGMSQDNAMSDYINLGNGVISKYGI